MNYHYLLLIFISSFLSLKNALNLYAYKLYKINDETDQGAKCLDGSNPAFYYRQGNSKKQIIIYFEEGDICGSDTTDMTIQKCSQFSTTNQGSSKNYESEIYIKDGILQRNLLQNSFYDWTGIIIKSCDGTAFQGFLSSTIRYGDKQLYFRGGLITRVIISYLQQNFQLNEATEVLVAGGGQAGGLAVFLWANFIKEQINFSNANVRVRAIPDSGIFLNTIHVTYDYFRYRTWIKNMYNLVDKEYDMVNHKCLSANANQPWECLFAQNLIGTMEVDTYIIQTEYQNWSISNILGIDCVSSDNSLKNCNPDQIFAIEQYRTELLTIVKNQLDSHPQWGAYMPACVANVLDNGPEFNSASFKISGYKLEDALKQWVNDVKTAPKQLIDQQPWPANKGCSTYN